MVRLPRIRLSIRGMMMAIAISAVFVHYIALPAWVDYRLSPLTRRTLGKLRMPTSLSISAVRPFTLADLTNQIEKSSIKKGEKGYLYVDPMGLQEADHTMASPVGVTTDHLPIKEHLARALPALGLDYFVKDGLLTITSAASARRAIQENPQEAIQP